MTALAAFLSAYNLETTAYSNDDYSLFRDRFFAVWMRASN